jgi:hypothetical protein
MNIDGNTWKQSAKKQWRRARMFWFDLATANQLLNDENTERIRAEATASHLRELLRRWNKKRVERGEVCPFCFERPIHTMYPPDVLLRGTADLYYYEDSHADGCELDKEIGEG